MANSKAFLDAVNQIPSDFTKETVSNLLAIRHDERPESDAQCLERINQYFKYCSEHSMRPGIESLALSLGVSRISVFNWSKGKGCSPERQQMILAAVQLITSNLEQAFMSGKINPISGIFLLKNWCGYEDKTSLNVNTSNNADDLNDDDASIEELAKKYSMYDITEKSE